MPSKETSILAIECIEDTSGDSVTSDNGSQYEGTVPANSLADDTDTDETKGVPVTIEATVSPDRMRLERLAAVATIPHDSEGFAQLVKDLTPVLGGVARRSGINPSDYDDCLNETFLRMWRSRERFTNTHGTVTGWACRILTNIIFDRYRSEKVHRAESLHAFHEAGIELAFRGPDIEEQALAADALRRVIQVAIDKNKKVDLSLLLTSLGNEQTYSKLAKERGTTEAAIKIRINRLRGFLRKALGDITGDLA